MFTGIIQSIAAVKKAEQRNSSLILTIATPRGWKLKSGDSIATDGACLTVTKIGRGWYQTELMAETLKRTTFGRQIPGKVNLERPLRPRDFIDGHIVQGHVDTIGTIVKFSIFNFSRRERDPDSPSGQFSISSVCTIRFPKKFSKLIVEKGSITIDGTSLTVVDVGRDWFSVALIPFTLKETTIGLKKQGEIVNLEFDVVGKYVQRLLA